MTQQNVVSNDEVVQLNSGVMLAGAAEVGKQPVVPDPEVMEKPVRRKFTAEYKSRISQEANNCAPGELGALLRQEGLYSSHLVKWQRQLEQDL